MTGKVSPKRILFVHDYPPIEGGGIEVSVYKTAKELVARGYKVTIATSRLTSETYVTSPQIISNQTLRVVHISDSKILTNEIDKADIVHIYFTFSFRPASLYGLKYAVENGKPTIFSIRTSYKHLPFSNFMKLSALERCEKIGMLKHLLSANNVFISGPTQAIKQSLEYLLIEKDIHVINNGTEFCKKKITAKQQFNIEPVDVTYVGELSFMKGINYLLDAFRIFKEEGKNYKLRLVGSGSDAETISTLIKHFELENNVLLAGYQPNENIPCFLQKTKLYVQPSLTELWSNSVLEAMSQGIPVICTNVDGMNEMLNNGKYGELIKPADAINIHGSISKLLNNFEYNKHKAEMVQAEITRKYTMENQVNKMCALYNQI